MSGLELCPKCKKGHLYPVVTASPGTETKGQFRDTGNTRDYECAICGYKQKGPKPVEKKNKVSASVKKIKRTRAEPTKAKTKVKRKRTKL